MGRQFARVISHGRASTRQLLRVFHAVAKCQGFTAAETELNIGQPTISSHIKDLEDRLGFELCERGRAGFRLTPAGERLYEATQRLERDLAGFVSTANEIRHELRGAIRIGITHILSRVPAITGLPMALRTLRREFPAVQVEIHLDTPSEIEQGVIDGRYDLAISGIHLQAKNVEVQRLFDMRMHLYCGQGHELFNLPDDQIDDALLSQFAVVLNSYDTQWQVPFGGSGAGAAESSEVSIFFILSSAYIGYLSEFVADPLVAGGMLRALRPQKYCYEAPGGLILPERAAGNPVVKKVVELLREFASTPVKQT